MQRVNIGIIGFGTIGGGVVKVLTQERDFLKKKTGIDIAITKICDKDINAKRPVKMNRKILTSSIGKVLYDPDIDIVVELIGGIRPAKDIILEALRQGKHVVTANKALLSDSGSEIFNLASTLGLSVGFEASVGGGIPIIKALREGFIANKVELIYGIINGTSNFILTKMAREGIGFKTALSIAQAQGFAEKNPYLDISGADSAHKLSILALLGFGIAVKPKDIYTEGIVGIEPMDIEYAKEAGYAVKLLAIAKKTGDSLELRVHPTLVSLAHLLANVSGVYNAIFVKGDLAGENLFYGQGAGAKPTSSAVVSDIVAIAKVVSKDSRPQDRIEFTRTVKRIKKISDVKMRHYIRFYTLDKPGVLAKISSVLAKYKISIASVIQKEKNVTTAVPIVMMTHEALERDMARALKEIDRLPMIKKRSVRIRMEECGMA